jgi:para-nitrobenzyl esterase
MRSGHGLDLTLAGTQLFGTFYTYDGTGRTEWLLIQVSDSETPSGALLRFTRSGSTLTQATAGQFSIRATSTCSDGIARPDALRLLAFDFSLDGREGRWCIEPLLSADDPHAVLNGAWFDPLDSGWGIFSHHYRGTNGSSETFRTVYYHDAAGAPRWAFAQDRVSSLTTQHNLFAPFVECFGCPAPLLLVTPSGSMELTLRHATATRDASINRVKLNVGIDGGARFIRDSALALLSEPVRLADAASTREGPVQGSLESSLSSFKNIPFAAPPVGALRWAAPALPPMRGALLKAQSFGPGCHQPPGQGFFTGAPAVQNEDCLQLNIWRPQQAGSYPVMVWIHGGGLTQGSAAELISGRTVYDGSGLAKQGVVVVTINYRLGPFGYVALRDVQAESGRAGNDGVLDQIRALSWVRDHIAAFAGDPNRVTIFGESAGGVSTCALLAAPAARGLFQRAVVQSGNCLLNVPTQAVGFEQGDRLSSAAGCNNPATRLSCLRALTPEALLAAARPVINTGTSGSGESYGLIVDGSVLNEAPGMAISRGSAAQVPLMIGVNDDEQTTLTPANTLPATVAGYEAAIRGQFPTVSSLVLARYPAASYATPQAAYQDLLDDIRFTCSARRAAGDHASRGNSVFHYVLTESLPDVALAPLESFHGLDVVLLFGPRINAQAAERRLALSMVQDWADFAYGRIPGSGQNALWPSYQTSSRSSRELNSIASPNISDYHGAACSFWNTLVPL